MIKLHDAGIDWLTLTFAIRGNEYKAAKDLAIKIVAEHRAQKCEEKPFGWQGYNGVLFQGIFVGYREDGLMIRATSHFAKYVEKIIESAGIVGHATRLDFQTTASVGTAQTDYGRRVRREVEASAIRGGRAAQTNCANYKTLGIDSGLAIGSRSSDSYARFYNKSLEQRGRVADGLWRYEVELKGRKAISAWNEIRGGAKSYDLAQTICKDKFEKFGVKMSWLKKCPKFELPSSYSPTSREKKLNWLSSHVASSVSELVDGGDLEEVLYRLGLDKLVNIK